MPGKAPGGARPGRLRLLAPLAALCGLAALLAFMYETAARRELDERSCAENGVRGLLEQARDEGAAYVKERTEQRQRAEEALRVAAAGAAREAGALIRGSLEERSRRLEQRAQALRVAELERQLAERAEQERLLREQYEKQNAELAATKNGSRRAASQEEVPGLTAVPENGTQSAPANNSNDGLTPPPVPKLEGESAAAEPESKKDTPGEERMPAAPEVYEGPDWAERLLAGLKDELAALLPENATLAVTEKDKGVLLRLGELPGEGALAAEGSRSLTPAAGGAEWTVRVVAADLAIAPAPSAEELAGRVAALAGMRDGTSGNLRGVLFDKEGDPMLFFPRSAPTTAELPVPPRMGEWSAAGRDGGTLTFMEAPDPRQPCQWRIGLQVRLEQAGAGAVALGMLKREWQWQLGAAALLLAAAAGLAWASQGGRRVAPQLQTQSANAGKPTLERKPGELKGESGARLLLAEIPEGEAAQALAAAETRRARVAARGKPGSLKRLQEEHRGGVGAGASRILDHARSPVLRQLVRKVRPADGGEVREAPLPAAAREPEGNALRAREEFERLLRERKLREKARG